MAVSEAVAASAKVDDPAGETKVYVVKVGGPVVAAKADVVKVDATNHALNPKR